jgi:hypothetical protein
MAKRLLLLGASALAFVLTGASAAMACGGLVAPGHAEVLEKATTLAAWHAGYEHYVTGFGFTGAADRFGYIVPLPGVPLRIQKGGGWTLERLEREIAPIRFETLAVPAAARADGGVQVLQQVKIDALDITVVRGGGRDVAAWASKNGFALTPDAPRVLGRYSSKGAVFALARFDRADAVRRGIVEGQGETIQFTIRTRAPWIPLQILALGKAGLEAVHADLFTLTDDRPAFLPELNGLSGMTVVRSEQAEPQLLSDLRSDGGMSWLPPRGMWFTAMTLNTVASSIRQDLSIDGGGPVSSAAPAPRGMSTPAWWLLAVVVVAGLCGAWALWRPEPTIRPA